ncbi:MAG: sigma-54 dependent transcriptional regulator [Acidobacteriaceae bacterium]
MPNFGSTIQPTIHDRVRLLIADAASGRFLTSHFTARHYHVSAAADSTDALRLLRADPPAIVLLDSELPGLSTFELLERIKHDVPEAAVIVLVSANSPDPGAIFRLYKLGADDLLSKPVAIAELEERVAKFAHRNPGSGPGAPLPSVSHKLNKNTDLTLLYGASPAMDDIRNTIEQVADTTATVLIRGESGTGKEVTARLVFAHSSRRDRPFVKINCAAIPDELLESELFGYEPGAFTGANRQKLGRFEQAHHGTIFLDEISEMHPSLQAKLLHVLQDGSFSRLGGKREISVDVRVIAATNKQLEEAVIAGQFREDLFYRLNVITIHIPPLRERREEIPVLLTFFQQKYSEVYGKTPPPFSDAAVQRMMEYSWPGNIRELENLVKRYVIVGNEPQIIRELSSPRNYSVLSQIASSRNLALGANGAVAPPEAAPRSARPLAINENMPSLLEIGHRAAVKAENEVIERVLLETKWNRRQAAKLLKISYKAFLNKLKALEEEKQGLKTPPGG